ncbi:MAG: hypothetical protein V1929_09375 [bacterium]
MNTSPTLPAWNADDAAGSLAACAAWFGSKARETFLNDKTHGEMFFFWDAKGEMGAAQPPPGIERNQLTAVVKAEIERLQVYGVVHIAEAWMYLPKQKNDHTYKQVVQGEIAVSQLKPEDRTETLMVRMESRDGLSRIWLSPIVRSADSVALGDTIEISDPAGGGSGSFFN